MAAISSAFLSLVRLYLPFTVYYAPAVFAGAKLQSVNAGKLEVINSD
jgi:hypothetical protein